MRVLLVLHFFLPRHSAGTEVYTDSIARALKQRGHDVHLFFTEKVLSRHNYTLERREWHGIPCHVLTNNLLYASFDETFANPEVERQFRVVLDDVRPDVVHVQHVMLLSMGLPAIAKERGIPVLMTLHDFFLACARFGQLLEHGERVCTGPEPKKCANCMADFKFAQTKLQQRMISAIRWTKNVAGFDLAPVVDVLRGLPLVRGGGDAPSATQDEKADRARRARVDSFAPLFKRRDKAFHALARHVDRFLAPSNTVREGMAAFGLPKRKIHVLPLGIEMPAHAERKRREHDHVVFGFIGTLAPHKGVHVAIEAMRFMKGHGRLLVFGRRDYYPDYVARLEQLAQGLDVDLKGPVPRRDLAKAFAQIDVLVVPSIWFENFPIVIQEARAAGVPVVASNLGGMAEAVRHDVDGLLFAPGDAKALARAFAVFVQDRAVIERMRAAAPQPLTLDAHVDRVEEELMALVGRHPVSEVGS
jgi:glycosyltransferase involved in cell wall biosynthesis